MTHHLYQNGNHDITIRYTISTPFHRRCVRFFSVGAQNRAPGLGKRTEKPLLHRVAMLPVASFETTRMQLRILQGSP